MIKMLFFNWYEYSNCLFDLMGFLSITISLVSLFMFVFTHL